MAVTIQPSFEVVDHEPRAQAPVDVSCRDDDDAFPLIRLEQGSDLILMTPDHARAVADAIGQLLNSTAKE